MMFAVKIKDGPIGALRNNRWAACTAPSKANTLLTGYLIRLLVTIRKHAHAIFRDFLSSKAVLTSTHNLCFGAKIRKIDIPLQTPVLLYKSEVQGGKHYTDMFS